MKAEKETLVLGVGNLLLKGHGRASFIKLAARI